MYSYCYHKKKAKQKSTIMGVHCVAVYSKPIPKKPTSKADVGADSRTVSHGRKLTMKQFSLLLDEDNILLFYIKKAPLFKG